MMPGDTNRPVPSTTSAPFGIDTFAPTAAILPARITTVPLAIVPRVAVSTVAPLMATTSGVRVCACGRDTTAATARADSRNTRTLQRRVVMCSLGDSIGRVLFLIVARLGAHLEHVLVEPFQVVIH